MAIWEKVFRRINWQNEPSVASPLDEDNLNRGDLALDQIDNRVIELNNRTSNLEGYETRVALLEQQASESKDSAKNSADLSENWAVGTPSGIRVDETTNNSKYYAEQSQLSANNAETSKIASESFAHGKTGTRTDEDIDNAEYYYEQCKAAAEGLSGALIPMGTLAFEDVPPIETLATGYMYNISNDFVTTDDFVQGAGYQETLGSNIYVLLHEGVKKFDILAGTPVTGVKGDKETIYRKGNVSLSPENIGAMPVEQGYFTSDDTTLTPTAKVDVPLVESNESLPTFFNKITNMFRNIRYLLKMLGDTDISTIGDGTVTGAVSQIDTSLKTKANVSESGYSLAVSGRTVSLKNKSGTELSKIITQDTTYGTATTSSNGLLRALNGSTSNYLRGDGTWQTPPNNNNYPYLLIGPTRWTSTIASGGYKSAYSFSVAKPSIVFINVDFPQNSTGTRGVQILSNGGGTGQSMQVGAAPANTTLQITGYVPAGTVTINALQSSGSNMSISGYYSAVALY